jgi:hypothetical protein
MLTNHTWSTIGQYNHSIGVLFMAIALAIGVTLYRFSAVRDFLQFYFGLQISNTKLVVDEDLPSYN